MEKGVLHSNLPIDADLERSWDLGSAIKRVKDWATSDGKINYQKYSKAFLWVEGEGNKQEDYKLPFADIIDGEIKAVYLGLSAAMKAVVGEKSGVDMADEGRKELLEETASYYKQFDPELKSVNAFIGEPSEAHKTAAEVFEALKTQKGAVADELAADEAQEAKMDMLEDFWEVIYAFCDVFYDEETAPDQFATLLNEAIGLLQQIADDKYQDADDNDGEPVGAALANGLDKEKLAKFRQSYFDGRPQKAMSQKKIVESGEKLIVKAYYDAKEKIAIASTSVVDRQGERIDQGGWDLKNFKNNPLLLWAHDHSEISVGNARNIHLDKTSGTPRLVFTPDFHDKTDKARALKALYEEGRMNSFSVGFIPKDMDGATSTYLKQELLEISACNVPANPEAMMLSYKTLEAAGIPEKTMNELGIHKMDEGKMKSYINGAHKATKKAADHMGSMKDGMKAMDESTMKEHIAAASKAVDETAGHVTHMMDEMGMEPTKSIDEPVVDKTPPPTDDVPNEPPVKAQKPSAAPQESSSARAEQSLIKVIAKASDLILLGEKQGQEQDERVKMQRIIKRAAEILSTSQRRKLEDGKTR